MSAAVFDQLRKTNHPKRHTMRLLDLKYIVECTSQKKAQIECVSIFGKRATCTWIDVFDKNTHEKYHVKNYKQLSNPFYVI